MDSANLQVRTHEQNPLQMGQEVANSVVHFTHTAVSFGPLEASMKAWHRWRTKVLTARLARINELMRRDKILMVDYGMESDFYKRAQQKSELEQKLKLHAT